MLKLKQLRIRNFRNISDIKLKVENPFVCFTGENAQGKTNILESIYLLGNIKSFRDADINTFIKNGEIESKVESFLEDKIGEYSIDYEITKKEKKYYLNKKPVNTIRKIIPDIKITSYTPDSYNLISGEDSYRRKFLDRINFFINELYIKDLVNYNKVLKNRNYALKKNKDYKIWDSLFVKYSNIVTENRINVLEKITPYINNYFKYFFKDVDIKIDYKQTTFLDKEKTLYKLRQQREKDEKLGFTNIGPNRDKIEIFLNDKEAKKVFSTGQLKLLAFVFKLAEIEIIQNITKKNVIFLYDDVNAFLDKERLIQLIEIIKKKNIQIFSSSVDNSFFMEYFSDSVFFITVRDGRLKYE